MSNIWYARYPGDYARDTSHLSMIEDGAYTRLLDAYFSREGPLPESKATMYRICRAMTPEEQLAVDLVLKGFFSLQQDGYHNKRADRELLRRSNKHSTLSESGALGAAKRWNKNKLDGQANGHPIDQDTNTTPTTPVRVNMDYGKQCDNNNLHGHAYSQANGQANGLSMARPQSQSQEEKKESAKTAPRHRSTCWPEGFILTEPLLEYAKQNGVADPGFEWRRFENHHRAKGSTFKDWNRAWQSWVLRAREYGQTTPSSKQQLLKVTESHVGSGPVLPPGTGVNPKILERERLRREAEKLQ